jgi:ABC-type nitrate/sulfonate/bicarbonate transport system substrate-binding protein
MKRNSVTRSFFATSLLIALVVTSACGSDAKKESSPGASGSFEKKITIADSTGNTAFSHLPRHVAVDNLKKAGWSLEETKFNGQDLIAEAVASGNKNFGHTQSLDALKTVQAGGDVVVVLEDRPLEFVIAAKKGWECGDLDGKPFGTQSAGSAYMTLSAKWAESKCGAKPKPAVVPDGGARIAGMMNGQIPAAALQLSDWITLNAQAPGQFPVLVTFAEAFPALMGSVIMVNKTWLKTHKETVIAYIEAYLKSAREANKSPDYLDAVAKRDQLPADYKNFQTTYKAYIDEIGGFAENGGLTTERIQAYIDLMTSVELIKPGLTPDKAYDLSYLNAALDNIGRVEGKN